MLAFLGGRASLLYLSIALVLMLVLCVTAALSTIDNFREHARLIAPAALRDAARIMLRERAMHRPLSDAAGTAWDSINRPFDRLIVLDDRGQRVFDSAPRDASTTVGDALVALFGVPNVSAPIPGGEVIIAPGASRLTSDITRSIAWTVPVVVVGVLIAARLIAGELRRREAALAISQLSQGTFDAPPAAPAGMPEINAITAAYNAFALNLERTVAEREKAAESIRNFVSEAGHELKTPLTIIMGYLDVVANGLVSDREDAERILQRTLGECRRMRATIEKLIQLARLDRDAAAEVPSVDVGALACEIADSLRPLAPTLHVELPPDGAARAAVDERDLREAIVNVIDNAIKYAPESPIDLRVTTPGDCVVVEIVDDGPGMSSEDRLHAFDRFHRGSASANVEGSGLGLAIAKHSIERASGRITLTSEIGRGTAVTMYLPCAPHARSVVPSQ